MRLFPSEFRGRLLTSLGEALGGIRVIFLQRAEGEGVISGSDSPGEETTNLASQGDRSPTMMETGSIRKLRPLWF